MHSVRLLFGIILLSFAAALSGQEVTKVRGKVYDAKTGELIPFATISFIGTSVGTSSDDVGEYSIDTRFPSDTIECAFLGYKTIRKPISRGDRQTIDFAMEDESITFNTVDIIAKKQKYSKKNNPALELAKKIRNNRDKNRLKGLDFYSFDQYEKINLDLNNITEDFKNTRLLRNLDFMWEYIDTSDINGKTYLPVFLRELLSKIYYKKDGNTLKEYRNAMRYTNLTDELDISSLNDGLDILYNEVDIYADEIPLLENQFVSPLAGAGVDFYRYYILDTIDYKGRSVIDLAFIPAIKGNLGFVGNIYVSNDDRYTVLKVDMGIVKDINLNFIRDMRIIQEFEELGDQFIKSSDKVVIDYSLSDNGLGAYGTRTVYYDNYSFEAPEDMSVFSPLEKVINNPEGLIKPDSFWSAAPLYQPTQQDLDLYEMIAKLREHPTYKRYIAIGRVVSTGFIEAGKVDIGPIATFVSFNDVEGLNLRFGGETNFDFSKKIKLQAYGARAFGTDIWKYSGGLTYTFNEDFKVNPRRFLQFTAEREGVFPGQELQFFNPNNFLLSFQRGEATKMLLERTLLGRYRNEQNGYAFELGVKYKNRQPYGSLTFDIAEPEPGAPAALTDINTFEGYIRLRYAPNEQFLQGQTKRRQLYNEFPIITLNLTQGFADFGGGDYSYTKLNLHMFKQFEWTTAGTTDMILEGGKLWGTVPYLLQYIPRGNQTYAYQLPSYNMMNFLEFSSDQYASFTMEHFFYGYFLNRIPLIKKLKLREIVTFKALIGSLSDRNNPNLNPQTVQFERNADGVFTTYPLLGDTPYLEASIGFSNILKILRIDLVQRFNYLDHPNLPVLFGQKGMGIRANFLVEF